jgi:TolA-binding protein
MKDYDAAIQVAEAEGVLDIRERMAETDLWMLANAARYARRQGLAEELLTLYRERFAAANRANTAAFLLATSALTQKSFQKAKKWLEVYLSESPAGPLAEEALGHLMTVHHQLGDNAQAQQLAKTYLKKYRGGFFAKQAEQLLQQQTGNHPSKDNKL